MTAFAVIPLPVGYLNIYAFAHALIYYNRFSFMELSEKQRAFSLRKKCSNMEIFLVHIFLYSVQIKENTDQKKLGIWTLLTQCLISTDEVAESVEI